MNATIFRVAEFEERGRFPTIQYRELVKALERWVGSAKPREGCQHVLRWARLLAAFPGLDCDSAGLLSAPGPSFRPMLSLNFPSQSPPSFPPAPRFAGRGC